METAAPVLTKPGVYFPHEPGLNTCQSKSLAKVQMTLPLGRLFLKFSACVRCERQHTKA